MSKVIALIPSHNEQEQLGACLESLLAQTRPIDRVLVILDNCTDGTEDVVRRFPGVEYMHTVDNPHKKAGALNQALPHCDGFEFIVDTDADSILDSRFVERSLSIIEGDPKIGAVSAREGVKSYPNMSWGQRIIYGVVRYQRYLWDTMRMENPGNTTVVVGPGSLLRTEAINQIGGWDNLSLTEDNAMSLDLRLAGWKTVLGVGCYVWSDTPLNVRELWSQRVRWSRGAEDFKSRPWSRATYRGKVERVWGWFLLVWTFALAGMLILNHNSGYNPLWLIPIGLIYAERLSRMRLFPEVHIADVVLALPPFELVTFMAWQATSLTALYQRKAGIARNW